MGYEQRFRASTSDKKMHDATIAFLKFLPTKSRDQVRYAGLLASKTRRQQNSRGPRSRAGLDLREASVDRLTSLTRP
jgi:hypothetical protein